MPELWLQLVISGARFAIRDAAIEPPAGTHAGSGVSGYPNSHDGVSDDPPLIKSAERDVLQPIPSQIGQPDQIRAPRDIIRGYLVFRRSAQIPGL